MAKTDLGIKRVCPETGRKFYDLNKDPIVSPYTGKTYPLSYFETGPADDAEEEEEVEAAELGGESEDVEVVSLEDAEEKDDTKADDPDVDLEDEDDVDLGDDDDDDTFLEDDDEDEDVAGIIDVDDDDDET